jgi:hypothetical protein
MAIDVSNLGKKTKTDKLRQVFFRVLVLVLVAAGVFAVIMTKDLWYPKLEGILKRVPELPGTTKLAEGNYPIKLPDGEDAAVRAGSDGVAVVTDTKTAAYDAAGRELLTKSHTFENPAVYAYDNEFVAYDIGGMNFAVYRKGKLRYEKKLEEQILLGRVKDGLCGIVTKGSKHPAVLAVFDNTGQNIFNYKSIERIIDVTFDRTGTGCYITLIDSKTGDLVTSVVYYSFTEAGRDQNGTAVPQYKSPDSLSLPLSTVLIQTELDDNVLIVGDKSLTMLTGKLELKKQFAYDDYGYPIGYSTGSDTAAVLFKGAERNSGSLVIMDVFGQVKHINVPYEVTAVAAVSSQYGVLALTDGRIDRYSVSGALTGNIPLTENYSGMITGGGYIYLLGYDEINRIDLIQ